MVARIFRAEAMQQWHAATMAALPSSVLRSVAAQSSCRDKAATIDPAALVERSQAIGEIQYGTGKALAILQCRHYGLRRHHSRAG